MIVRIMGEDQYQLDEQAMRTIASLDNAMQEAILQDDQARFSQVLHQLVRFVQERGEVVPAEALVKSDVIIPSADMTLHEARRYVEKPIP